VSDVLVGTRVMAPHPFTDGVASAIVLNIRHNTEEYGRGPFFLVRFEETDNSSFHSTYVRNPIIRRWVQREDLEIIE